MQPKKIRYSKVHKGKFKITKNQFNCNGHCCPKQGYVSLYSLEHGFVNSSHLETGRRIIRNSLQRRGTLWVTTFPFKPLTQKPTGTRMGKGKGNVSSWVATIHPGKTLYELDHVNIELAKKALLKVIKKLPLKTKISIRKKILLLKHV